MENVLHLDLHALIPRFALVVGVLTFLVSLALWSNLNSVMDGPDAGAALVQHAAAQRGADDQGVAPLEGLAGLQGREHVRDVDEQPFVDQRLQPVVGPPLEEVRGGLRAEQRLAKGGLVGGDAPARSSF